MEVATGWRTNVLTFLHCGENSKPPLDTGWALEGESQGCFCQRHSSAGNLMLVDLIQASLEKQKPS